jgi:hypothetical protein
MPRRDLSPNGQPAGTHPAATPDLAPVREPRRAAGPSWGQEGQGPGSAVQARIDPPSRNTARRSETPDPEHSGTAHVAPDPLEAFGGFVSAVRSRLEAGRRAYGDRSFSAPPVRLLEELQAEALDLAGWGFVLWVRLEAMRKGCEHGEPSGDPR